MLRSFFTFGHSSGQKQRKILRWTGSGLICCLAAFGLATATLAQTSTLVPDGSNVTVEDIQGALDAAAVQSDLDETTRSRLVDLLRQAQESLRSQQSSEAAAAGYAATVVSAPEDIQRLRSKLDESVPPPPTAASLGIDEGTPTTLVQGSLTGVLVELAAVEARLSALEAEAAAEADRPTQIRQRLAELAAGQDVTALSQPSADENPVLAKASQLVSRLEKGARTAESQRLEQELLSHGLRLSLISAQRDAATREIADVRRRVEVLQDAVNARRQSLADQAQEEAALAELAAADEHPAVRQLAEGNAQLTRQLPAIATDIQRITGDVSEVEAQARNVEQSLARALKRLELGGVNQLLGRLLIEQQRGLPRSSVQRAEMRRLRRDLAEVSLAQMQSEEQRRELTPIDDSVERVLAEITDVTDSDELGSIREKVELLLRNRRDLLQQISSSYASQVSALNEADLAQNRLRTATADFDRFFDRNLLWIPSATLFGPEQIRQLKPAIGRLVEPASWATSFSAMGVALRRSLMGTLAALLALGLALYFRRSLAGAVVPTHGALASAGGEGLHGGQNVGIYHTLGALALAALRALPLPFLIAVLAWALHRNPTQDDFVTSLGMALAAVAPFLYSTLLLRALGSGDGVMQVHFGWPELRLKLLRRQASRLTLLGVPLVFVCALSYSAPNTAHGESLGRLTFVLLMALVSAVAYALLHPARGLLAPADGDAGLLLRGGHALSVAAPLLLALASLLGFSYTALTLAGHLINTYWLGLVLLLARVVVWRWLNLARRDLAAPAEDGGDTSDVESEPDVIEAGASGEMVIEPPPPPDLETVDRQSKRLLDAGFVFLALVLAWGIWSQVLPALGVLDRTDLWSQTVIVDGQETLVPVTLADLLLALLIAGVTVVAAKNLPGLLEIAVLKRAKLQPGSRYAAHTLLRYVIILVGTITAVSILGWRWSQIQWLAAAISVGLGFGLQEIVANFVSGLVILFERPVRVGDTVTVGDITGTISRVRIRATTITDWDRKEIIVPNKALITEQVTNWTLTDPITRVVVPVGIGYGSDIVQAQEIMTRTLQRLPLVLDDPPPKVYFVGFGDSSLDFKLNVYARQLSDRMPLLHAVHEEILQALRDADIEIPFPQRDVHMR